MRAVFVDTSAFFAVLAIKDPAHGIAVSEFAKLRQESQLLCTTDHVIGETLTLLRVRGYNHLCDQFYRSARGSPELRIEMTSSDRFWQTSEFFLKHADKGYSFTDCLSFLVMRQLKLTTALTTDQHFAQAGFRALLV